MQESIPLRDKGRVWSQEGFERVRSDKSRVARKTSRGRSSLESKGKNVEFRVMREEMVENFKKSAHFGESKIGRRS